MRAELFEVHHHVLPGVDGLGRDVEPARRLDGLDQRGERAPGGLERRARRAEAAAVDGVRLLADVRRR